MCVRECVYCVRNHNVLCHNKSSLQYIHVFMFFSLIAGILNTVEAK
jgi:hypothetical protein